MFNKSMVTRLCQLTRCWFNIFYCFNLKTKINALNRFCLIEEQKNKFQQKTQKIKPKLIKFGRRVG